MIVSAGEGMIISLSLGDPSREKKTGGEAARIPLRLTGAILGRPDFPRAARILANEQKTLEKSAQKPADALQDPEQSLELDLPRQTLESIRADLALPLDRTVVLEVAPGEVEPMEGAPDGATPRVYHRALTVRVDALEIPEEE